LSSVGKRRLFIDDYGRSWDTAPSGAQAASVLKDPHTCIYDSHC